jgi:hypothetical protein
VKQVYNPEFNPTSEEITNYRKRKLEINEIKLATKSEPLRNILNISSSSLDDFQL